MTNQIQEKIFGAITALITPFNNGKVDEAGYQKFIDWQINNGVKAIIPVGTTGESATLNDTEHWRVFELAVEAANKRVPVIAGCGSNDTKAAIEHMEKAKERGCDAALIVAPYYNKPNQRGIFAHFKALNDAVDLPIIVYNIPGRTNIDILPSTIAELSQLSNVIGLKDSAGDPSRTSLHYAAVKQGFNCYAGDDNLALGFAAYGAKGVVSVLSNLVPNIVSQMQAAIQNGDFAKAREINLKIDALQRALFIEPNPVPVKYAMLELGIIKSDEVRLPLVELSDESKKAVKDAMAIAGL